MTKRSVLISAVLLLLLCVAAWFRDTERPRGPSSSFAAAPPQNEVVDTPIEKLNSKIQNQFASTRRQVHQEFNPISQPAAATQPQTALELVLALEDGPERNDLLQSAVSAWLQTDPTAALNWADAVEEPAIRRIMIRQHMNNLLAADDAAGAAGWIESIPESPDRNALVTRVSEAWGRLESEAAWRWGTSLPEGETRSLALQAILSSWAAKQPVEAANAVVTQLPPKDQSAGVLAVLLSWTQTDPTAAAAWVSRFSESTLRETATQNVVGNWALRDGESARQWLEGLPAGPSRDAGILTWHSLEPESRTN